MAKKINNKILEAKRLKKTYKISKGNIVHALNGLDLDIKKGEIIAIMGPSGSGKSTLLNMFGILDTPTNGKVIIDTKDISREKKSEYPVIRSDMVGFIFQQYNLIPTLTALENVMLPLKYSRVKKKEAKKKTLRALEEVGMKDRAKSKPTQLSGGQQQRVAIARALVNEPAIVLADEPTGNLDTKTSEEIIDMMLKLNKKIGQTLVIVTHNPEITRIADRVVYLRDGKIEKIK
jgi:putative ABC transport system ATP-binding protein